MAAERRAGVELEELTTAECVSLLQAAHVGRVAFAAAGGMMHVIPVNFLADHEGRVVFRTSGSTMLNQVSLSAVAFEIDGFDDAGRTGWSVCVHGVGREITDADDDAATALRTLGVDPWAPGDRSTWLAVIPLEITGRRLRSNPDATDGGWWFPGIPTS
jgi:nitroimidazol reductase NimA-like FMN-containing flavoprotein (pyridoxamine 5'-phosphate oxidase superfamily)